jgi:hypothetical protein
VLTVRADSVLFCLIPDTQGTNTTATAMIERCPADPTITPSTANNCLNILDAVLTGTEGGDATQNACVRAGPGRYRVVGVAGGAGDFPILTAEAEE